MMLQDFSVDEDTYVGSMSDYDPSRHGLGGIRYLEATAQAQVHDIEYCEIPIGCCR